MPSPIEIAAAAITLLSIYLSGKENIWSWPTAIVGVGLYAFLFFETKLYADFGLQFIYMAISVYGWYEWLHGGKDHGRLEVSPAPRKALWVGAIIALLSTILLGTFLRATTDAALPFADSALTSFSLLAQFLMTKKYPANWVIWIAVDVCYVALFMYKHLYVTAFVYAVFIPVCAMAYAEWKRSMRNALPAPA